MNQHTKQCGSILLIAIALIVGVSLLAVAFTSLYVGDTASSADHATSSQALFVAESGLSNALENFRTGTACAALNLNNVAFGNGTFTATGTLFQPAATTTTAAITAVSTVIPVNTTVGYAPHGRITIQAEQIDYAAIVGNTFTGARRGVNGTVAAAHANGQAVTQSQCLVRSTGTVGASRRVLEAGVLPGAAAVTSALFDTPPSGAISTLAAGTNIGGNFVPALPIGTNLLIGAVSLSNITATQSINGGNLSLRRSGAVLASNQFPVRLGGGAVPPSTTSFARASMFLLHRQINVPANPVYTVNARTTGGGTTIGEAKLLVLNTPTAGNSAFTDGVAVNSIAITAGNAANNNLINNVAFAVPAGDRLVIAAVQFYNNNAAVGANRSIAAGALTLRKGNGAGPVLASNQFAIDLSISGAAHPGASLLLLARDPTGALNQRYSVNAVASGTNLQGEAKVIVVAVNGITAAVFDGGSVPVLNADTVVGSLPTALAAGQHAVIAATQFVNSANGVRNIPAGQERVVSGLLPTTISEFNTGLCASATFTPANAICDDFTSGLLWRNNAGLANPTFEVHAQADNLGINAETKILAISMVTGIGLIDWLEVFQ